MSIGTDNATTAKTSQSCAPWPCKARAEVLQTSEAFSQASNEVLRSLNY